MKTLKITLKSVIVFLIFAFIALVFARIAIADHYPSNVTDFVFTEKMKEAKSIEVDNFHVYTQDLMAPYDDAKKGNFFAAYMQCVPAYGELQATLRYNKSSLANIAAYYDTDIADDDPLNLFSFSLLVSYETEDENGLYRRFELNRDACRTDSFLMYRYAKLVFEDVDFQDAVWMRVDIFLRGTEEGYTDEKRFGSIVLYESYEIYKTTGQRVDYPLKDYKLSHREENYD